MENANKQSSKPGRNLNLVNRDISTEKAMRIAEIIEKSVSLKFIQLRNCKIADDEMQCIAEALKRNATITSINLIGSNITNKGVGYIAEALKVNTTLININLQERYILNNPLRDNKIVTNLNCRVNLAQNLVHKAIAKETSINKCLSTKYNVYNEYIDNKLLTLACLQVQKVYIPHDIIKEIFRCLDIQITFQHGKSYEANRLN